MKTGVTVVLPHKHFAVSASVIAPAALILSPGSGPGKVVEWIAVGGILSALMDLDVYVLTVIRSAKEKRLRSYRNPLEIFRKFERFKDAITETGVLKFGLATHLGVVVLVLLAGGFFAREYLVPAALGVLSHLVTDLPNLRRLKRSEN